jgi:hypothetical protein
MHIQSFGKTKVWGVRSLSSASCLFSFRVFGSNISSSSLLAYILFLIISGESSLLSRHTSPFLIRPFCYNFFLPSPYIHKESTGSVRRGRRKVEKSQHGGGGKMVEKESGRQSGLNFLVRRHLNIV